MDIKIKNILVVGLGSMGFGIAQSLIRAGYSVFGQDKNPKQSDRIKNLILTLLKEFYHKLM